MELNSSGSSILCICVIGNDPKGPKIEKTQDCPPGVKFSIEIENIKRATQQKKKKNYFFVGHPEGQD